MPALPLTGTICLGFTLISHGSKVFHHIRQNDISKISSPLHGLKISRRIDVRQFGTLSKTSTTHYFVHLVHTILSNLDKPNV